MLRNLWEWMRAARHQPQNKSALTQETEALYQDMRAGDQRYLAWMIINKGRRHALLPPRPKSPWAVWGLMSWAVLTSPRLLNGVVLGLTLLFGAVILTAPSALPLAVLSPTPSPLPSATVGPTNTQAAVPNTASPTAPRPTHTQTLTPTQTATLTQWPSPTATKQRVFFTLTPTPVQNLATATMPAPTDTHAPILPPSPTATLMPWPTATPSPVTPTPTASQPTSTPTYIWPSTSSSR